MIDIEVIHQELGGDLPGRAIQVGSLDSLQAVSQTCADLPLAQQELDEECRRLRGGAALEPGNGVDPEISMEFSSPDSGLC
jgi:hypothetical protein